MSRWEPGVQTLETRCRRSPEADSPPESLQEVIRLLQEIQSKNNKRWL